MQHIVLYSSQDSKVSERQPLPSRDLSFRRSDYAVISIPIIKVAYRICHESQK